MFGKSSQWEAGHLRDIQAGERYGQRFQTQPFTSTERAVFAHHMFTRTPLEMWATGVGERVQHVALRTREGAQVAGRFLAANRALHFGRIVSGVHRHLWLLIGEEQPLAIFTTECAPRYVDIETKCDADVPQVLPMPSGWPGSNRTFTDTQRWIRNE